VANKAKKIIIRPARKSDGKNISSFLRSFPKEQVLQNYFPDYKTSFVAVDLKGRVIGHCGLDISKTGLAELRSLAVAKEYRRLGIASKLVTKCVKLARRKKMWEVFAVTGAEKFLKTQGFRNLPKHMVFLFKDIN